jgi:hypothetical protein
MKQRGLTDAVLALDDYSTLVTDSSDQGNNLRVCEIVLHD